MAKFVLKDPLTFSKVMKIMSQLVEEIEILIDAKGWSVVTMDSAHVFLIELELPASGFSDYQLSEESGPFMTMTFKAEAFAKVLSNIHSDDLVSISCTHKEADFVQVSINCKDSGSKTSNFQVHQIIVVNSERNVMPSQDYVAAVMMPPNALVQICSELKQVGENVSIQISEKSISFASSSNTLTVEISLNHQDPVLVHCSEMQSQLYAFSYFQKMCKAAKTCGASEVLLQLKNGAPLSMCYTLPIGSLNFYLAPLLDTNIEIEE